MKKDQFRLIAPVFLVMILDLIFTMVGQSESYWANYKTVNEGSPLGFSLLSFNPLTFIVFFLIYLAIVYFLLKKLPLLLKLVLGVSLFLGHAWGSSSWLYRFYVMLHLPWNNFIYWYLTVGYFILVSFLAAIIIYPVIKKISKKTT